MRLPGIYTDDFLGEGSMGGEVLISELRGIYLELGMEFNCIRYIRTVETEESELVWGAEWGLPWPEGS